MKKNPVPAKRVGIALLVLILVIGVFFTVREIQNQQELRSKASNNVIPSPANTCTDIASQSACTWDSLPSAVAYDVAVIDLDSKKIIRSGSVQAPSTKFLFSGEPGVPYECSVIAINACGDTGDQGKSEPTACNVLQTPMPSPPICREDESKCTWDRLPEASEYLVKIIDTDSGETIKSGSVSASITEFAFPLKHGVSYKCEVTPVNQCGKGTSETSPPLFCAKPTATPTPTPTPTGVPTPTPTVPSTLSNTPTPTPYTVIPTKIPVPTKTPIPTATPYPTNTPVPPPVVQNPPTNPPQVLGQNPTYPTPTPPRVNPTIAPTGAFETSIIVAGIAMIMVAIGGAIFFIL